MYILFHGLSNRYLPPEAAESALGGTGGPCYTRSARELPSLSPTWLGSPPDFTHAANHQPSHSPFLRCSGWCKGCRADRSNPFGFNPSRRWPPPPDRPGGSQGSGEGKTQGSIRGLRAGWCGGPHPLGACSPKARTTLGLGKNPQPGWARMRLQNIRAPLSCRLSLHSPSPLVWCLQCHTVQ